MQDANRWKADAAEALMRAARGLEDAAAAIMLGEPAPAYTLLDQTPGRHALQRAVTAELPTPKRDLILRRLADGAYDRRSNAFDVPKVQLCKDLGAAGFVHLQEQLNKGYFEF